MTPWKVSPEDFLKEKGYQITPSWKVSPEDFLKEKGYQIASEEEPHKFSSTQVNLPDDLANKVRALGARIPDEHLAGDGRENEPHVTVKYGLHGEDSAPVESTLQGEKPINVKLGKTSIFPAKDEDIQRGGADVSDVVKIDVDSPDLHRLNKKIADAHPHTDTFPSYHPHVTVAYVKPGLGKHYAGMSDLEGQGATINSVKFSSKNRQVTNIPLTGQQQSIEDLQGDYQDNPVPESPEALKRQVDQLVNGQRQAVMFTPGAKLPPLPSGFNKLETEQGTFYYDPDDIGARSIKRAIHFGRLNDILGDKQTGYGAPPKQEMQGPPVAVVAQDSDGTDIQAVATDQANLPTTVAAAKQVAPNVRVEHPDQAVAKRVLDAAHQGVEINRGSSTEVPLSPQGHQEAERAAAKVGPVDSIIASDAVRTQQTAEPFSQQNPQAPVKPSKNLESWAQGDLEGRPHDEVQSQIDDLIKNAHKVPIGRGPLTTRAGESFDTFKQRLLPEFAKEMEDWVQNPSRKALIVHSQSIKTLKAWIANGMPQDLSINKKVLRQSSGETGGVEQLRYSKGKWEVNEKPNYQDPTGFYLVRHGHTSLNK